MPRFRLRTAAGQPERIIDAVQFHGPAADPPGVARESGGRIGRAYVIDALGRHVYLEPGDWILPDPDRTGHYLVSDPETFARAWEPVTPSEPAWRVTLTEVSTRGGFGVSLADLPETDPTRVPFALSRVDPSVRYYDVDTVVRDAGRSMHNPHWNVAPPDAPLPETPVPNVANAPDDAPDAHGDNQT
jgi:hypothetical protein